MECVVQAALKSSFRKDMTMKFSPQTLLEELSFNVQSVDDFIVDDFFDFSHEQVLQEEEPQQQNHDSASVSLQQENQHKTHQICNSSFNNGSFPTSELGVPAEDAANLEWLSHFVEDSFSEYSISFPTRNLTENLAAKAPEPGNSVSVQLCFKNPVPVKARSKRTRTGIRVWPFNSPSFTGSSSCSSSTSSSTTPSSSSSSSLPETTVTTNRVFSETKSPEKKAKRRAALDGGVEKIPRRCSHCGVQKTPQWRTGPLGAKTLCNACGVRFKSGRLLPEYRPASSPTFSSELHSNHHRKVLEMRQKKEEMVEPDTGLALSPVIPGF
ncbi:GATA transcription factor 5-like [Gastrolobium bilobum]|uniref:GATA transcription factor 5-like n=1 Tax=Gastrolobium bilobum TaxID=150636 RepID=UPI002AB1C496|nr:GATA transcription factor 5-like [Gastrolobium bilobum]